MSKSNTKSNSDEQKKTYLIKTDYATEDDLGKIRRFFGNNWCEIQDKQLNNKQLKYIDWVYVDGKAQWDKRLWKLNIGVFSGLADTGKYAVADKSELYENYVKINSENAQKYMMQQINVNLLDKKDVKLLKSAKIKGIFKNNDNNTWILKPVAGYKGSGIAVVDNYDDMINHLLVKKRKKTLLKRYQGSDKWVIAKYIGNPLLIMGKKFHIRMILMYYVNNKTGESNGYLFNDGVIFSAKKKYVVGRYFDKNIHDSHRIKGEEITFPYGFKDVFGKRKTDKVIKDIAQISHDITQILKANNAGCYERNENCYQLFGLDIMIDDQFNTKLIECNSKIGLSGYPNIVGYFKNIIEITV